MKKNKSSVKVYFFWNVKISFKAHLNSEVYYNEFQDKKIKSVSTNKRIADDTFSIWF